MNDKKRDTDSIAHPGDSELNIWTYFLDLKTSFSSLLLEL